VGAADALGPDLDERLDVLHGHVEEFEFGLGRVGIGLLGEPILDDLHRVVDAALSDGLFAVVHDAVDELGEDPVVVPRVGTELLFGLGPAACHASVLLARLPAAPAVRSPGLREARLLALNAATMAARGSGGAPRRGSTLAALGPVLGAALLALLDAEAVEGAADDVVADTREVADAAA